MAHMVRGMVRMVMSSGLMVAGVATPVQAGVWNTLAQGQLSVRYDDNLRMSTVREVAAWNSVADVAGRLSFQDDAYEWQVNPRFVASRYDGERALNRNEQYLSTTLQRRHERGDSRLLLSGTQDTTLTSELGLTGLAEVNKKHREGVMELSNNYRLTERLDTTVRLSASANRYLDAEQTGLIDYNYGSALLSTDYSLSELSQVSLQASMGKLTVPDIPASDKTNLSATLGYVVQFTPRWRAKLSYGPSQVRANGRTDHGTVYNASLTQSAQRSDLSLSLARDVTATGRGLLTRRDQVRLNWSSSLDERWLVSCAIAANRNRDVLPQGNFQPDSVTYADVTGSVSWRMTPTLSLSLSAGYARQKTDNGTAAAQRRNTALNVTWQGLPRRVH